MIEAAFLASTTALAIRMGDGAAVHRRERKAHGVHVGGAAIDEDAT